MSRLLQQAGAIPFRQRDGQLEVLLVTSRSSGDWIVPKGMVDPGLSAAEAAAQEAHEEAGVLGQLGPLLGYVQTAKARIAIFPLQVEEEMQDYLERGERKRRWFPAKEAAEKVRDGDLAVLIRRLRRHFRLQSPPIG